MSGAWTRLVGVQHVSATLSHIVNCRFDQSCPCEREAALDSENVSTRVQFPHGHVYTVLTDKLLQVVTGVKYHIKRQMLTYNTREAVLKKTCVMLGNSNREKQKS